MSKYPSILKKMKTTIEKTDFLFNDRGRKGSSRSATYLESRSFPSDLGVIPPLIFNTSVTIFRFSYRCPKHCHSLYYGGEESCFNWVKLAIWEESILASWKPALKILLSHEGFFKGKGEGISVNHCDRGSGLTVISTAGLSAPSYEIFF